MERYKGEIRAGRLPPEWSAKLDETVFEAVTKWDLVVGKWNLDIAT
jgi:hypothetical protein